MMGLAQLSDPLAGDFRAEHVRYAKMLGDFAAVGVKNGRRMLALQRLGLRDRDTAAYNLSYFTDYASKEIYKARRYGRTFSLLTFSVDNLPHGARAAGRGGREARGARHHPGARARSSATRTSSRRRASRSSTCCCRRRTSSAR